MDSSFPHRDGPVNGSGAARPKRGRKAALPDPDQGPVARFAHQLCELKMAAGDPSYDRMRAELGAAASKSALSAAARGQSLPSWETTWEFVRSLAVAQLGEDEDTTRRLWRKRWVLAEASSGTGEETASSPAPARSMAGIAERMNAPPARTALKSRQAGFAAVGVALIGATIAVFAISGFKSQPSARPPQYPLAGDNSVLVDELGIKDGTTVHIGEPFERRFVLQNTGNLAWDRRYLKTFGDTRQVCEVPEQVAIPHTDPGQRAEIPVKGVARAPGTCHVVWKMVDDNGQLFFPKQLRPVFFSITVAP